MDKLQEVCEIGEDFADIADSVLIYIKEAHATDGWSVEVSDSTRWPLLYYFKNEIGNIVYKYKSYKCSLTFQSELSCCHGPAVEFK